MKFSRAYIEKFYARHLNMESGKVSGEELRIPCPYHDDKNPSFSVNLTTGMYKCFTPDCKLFEGGNMYHFLSAITQVSVSEARKTIDDEYAKTNPIPEEGKKRKAKAPPPVTAFPYTQDDIDARVQEVLTNPVMLEFLQREMLWTVETIKRFEIGFDKNELRYWIPIKENKSILNIRKYSPAMTPKVISVTNFGEARLFPADNLQGDEIYIMEGEKDCMLANQLGLNAVTLTGGAGTPIKNEWKPHFADKAVYICYDIDKAGRDGAIKIAGTITTVARSVKIINLPIKEPDNADFTDYIKSGKTIQDFLALVDATPQENPLPEGPVVIPDEIYETSLDQIDAKKLFYRRTKVNVRVIGTESSPFIVPKSITITCNKDNSKRLCETCKVGDNGGKETLVMNESTPALLNLIECGTRDREIMIRDIFHIPLCKRFHTEESDHQAINRVSVIPAIDDIQYDQETYNQKYVERELYYIGDTLTANTDYEIEVLTVPSPKDQSMVHIGYKMKFSDSSIEEFQLTPDIRNQLEVFQCK